MVEQFLDVRKLNRKVEKAVFHFALRLAPDDNLTKEQFAEVGRACAKEFGLENNQFVTILHKDTAQQHIHIVANRVGLDGKVVSDSNSYKKMAALCRRLEKDYNLKQIQSPRRFQSPEERRQMRFDTRKLQLQKDIQGCLRLAHNYLGFEQRMQSLGYTVIKARGIRFVDDKKVSTKGSEVGYPLRKIEQVLAYKQQQQAQPPKQEHTPAQSRGGGEPTDTQEFSKGIDNALEILLRPENAADFVDPALLREAKKKKRKGHRM